jgi:hypothetical protein
MLKSGLTMSRLARVPAVLTSTCCCSPREAVEHGGLLCAGVIDPAVSCSTRRQHSGDDEEVVT